MSEVGDSTGGRGAEGGASGQAVGTATAKDYVPPQVLKAKPKGQVHGAKVQIKSGVDPRRRPTIVSRAKAGTQPGLSPPPEVAQYAADNALPFKPAGASASANHDVVGTTALSAAAPAIATTPLPSGPKRPPLRLVTPGEMRPLAAPLAGAAAAPAVAAAVVVPPAAAAPAAAAPAAAAPVSGAAAPAVGPAPVASVTPPPVVVDAAAPATPSASGPWGASATPVPASDDAAPSERGPAAAEAEAAAPKTESGEHPLAATDSPWSSAHTVDDDVLPSSAMLSPPSDASASVPAAAIQSENKGSRGGITIVLAVAALALVAAVAYFAFNKDTPGAGEPADVNVGNEQTDYGDQPLPSAKPKPKPKPSAKPSAKPVVRPLPPPPRPTSAAPASTSKGRPWPRRRPPPRPAPVDIYDD